MARDKPPRTWFVVLWTGGWAGLTLALMFVAVAYWTGFYPMEFRENAVSSAQGAFIVSLICAGITPAAVLMARSRRVEPVASAIPIMPERRLKLPRARSSARGPMVELAEAEVGLADLLGQLKELDAVPMQVIEDACRRLVCLRLDALKDPIRAFNVSKGSFGTWPALRAKPAALAELPASTA